MVKTVLTPQGNLLRKTKTHAETAMKLTCGLGGVEDFEAYVQAGADEVFIGYVPHSWRERFGADKPLNRREVLYADVQIGSPEDLRELTMRAKAAGVRVAVTFNALFFTEQEAQAALEAAGICVQAGADALIVADPYLLALMHNHFGDRVTLHASGEFGEINPGVMERYRRMGVKRVIFHRKVSLQEMETLIRIDRQAHPEEPMEYEAFLMNEQCHFHGGFCRTYHCDELPHMCHVPYRLGYMDEAPEVASAVGGIDGSVLRGCGRTPSTDRRTTASVSAETSPTARESDLNGNTYIPGSSGCGLCALPELCRIGITHLKIVGRGAFSDEMVQDIAAARRALRLLSEERSAKSMPKNEEELPERTTSRDPAAGAKVPGWPGRMKPSIFPDGCSGQCYYL